MQLCSKILGYNFQLLHDSFDINKQLIRVKNLQGNPPIEHIHYFLEDQLHDVSFQSRNYQKDLDDIIQVCAFSASMVMPLVFPYTQY